MNPFENETWVRMCLKTGAIIPPRGSEIERANRITAYADYASGEYVNNGRVVGALELAFKGGDLTNAITRTDLWDDVYAELRLNPQWRAAQASAERWSARYEQ